MFYFKTLFHRLSKKRRGEAWDSEARQVFQNSTLLVTAGLVLPCPAVNYVMAANPTHIRLAHITPVINFDWKIYKEDNLWDRRIILNMLICGDKMPTRCNRGFYCRSYCLLNMFRAPLCRSSGAQEYYTVVAAASCKPDT